MRPMRSPRAFTLIELLVVIAIIAILVSILMPALKKAKELAVIATCSVSQRGTLLMMHTYASDYNSFPDVRSHPRWDPTIPGESYTWSGSNGPIMRGYPVLYARQMDPDGYGTNRTFMCTSPDVWKPDLDRPGAMSWEWRLGSHTTPDRDGDPDFNAPGSHWAVTKQPYYKAILPGMSLWHHGPWEPNGLLAVWYKGLDRLVDSGTTQTTETCSGPMDRIVPPLPKMSIPMLVCPTWLKASDHPDYAWAHTPHGGLKRLPNNLNFVDDGPLERNIGFSDGHVRYYKTQTRDPQQ